MKGHKRLPFLSVIALLITALCFFVACGSTNDGNTDAPEQGGSYTVEITATGSTTIKASKTVQLRSRVVGTTEKDVTWTSSDDTIAVVSENGLVTGKKAGTVTIKATLVIDEKSFDTIEITVEQAVPPQTLALTGYPESKVGWVDEDLQLGVNVTPADASNEVTWTTSNADIATVTNGLVHFKTKGDVTITATSQEDTTKSASVDFTARYGAFLNAKSSSKWDLEQQDADEDANISIQDYSTMDGNVGIDIAYFAHYSGQKFYAEATFTDFEVISSQVWQGFGVGTGTADRDFRYFTFSPLVTGQGNTFRKTIVRDNPNGWGSLTDRSQMWGKNGIDDLDLTNGLKIAMLRDGNTYYYFINDAIFYVDVTEKFNNKDTIPAIVTTEVPVTVSSYRLVTDSDEVDALMAGDAFKKSFYPSNTQKVTYVNDKDFTFNVNNTQNKDCEVHSLGDMAFLLRSFEIEFEMENLSVQGNGSFNGLTVNLTRYDSANIIDTFGVGKSAQQADLDGMVARFARWEYTKSMSDPTSIYDWAETTAPVLATAAAAGKHKVKLVRYVDLTEQKSYFHLYIDEEEVTFGTGKNEVNAIVSDYIGAYIICVGGEYASCHVTGFTYNSDVAAADLDNMIVVTNESGAMEIGDTLQLTYQNMVGESEGCTYGSTNEAVATVSATGLITAVSTGTAYVWVKDSTGAKAQLKVTVAAAPEITCTNTDLELWPGHTLQLTYELSAETAHEIGFEVVSGGDCATMTAAGLITPVADGELVVKIYDKTNPAVYTTVTVTVAMTLSIKQTVSETGRIIELTEGYNTVQVTYELNFTPEDAVITYEITEGNTAATINATGLVTAAALGEFKVKVTVTSATEGTKSATETYYVKEKLAIIAADANAYMGSTYTVEYEYSYTTAYTATFTSSNTDVATVDATTGVVTPVAVGTTTVTLTCSGRSDVTKEVTITVKNPVIDATYQPDLWDYTNIYKDDATIATKAENSEAAPATALFSGISGKKYYAEATINCTNVGNWDWSRIAVGNAVRSGSVTFRAMWLGIGGGVKKLIVAETPNNWGNTTDRSQVWNSQQIGALDLTNVKLAVLRNGNKFYYYINDMLWWYEDLDTRFADVDTTPAISASTVQIVASNMFATADSDAVDAKLASLGTRQYYTYYPGNVSVNDETGAVTFTNLDADNFKDNTAYSVGDYVKVEGGKDSILSFKFVVSEYKAIEGNDAKIGITYRDWSAPTEARSFVIRNDYFGMTGWNINNNMPGGIGTFSAIPTTGDLAIDMSPNTEHTATILRTRKGYLLTLDGKVSHFWDYDSYDHTMLVGIGAMCCKATISDVTIEYTNVLQGVYTGDLTPYDSDDTYGWSSITVDVFQQGDSNVWMGYLTFKDKVPGENDTHVNNITCTITGSTITIYVQGGALAVYTGTIDASYNITYTNVTGDSGYVGLLTNVNFNLVTE